MKELRKIGIVLEEFVVPSPAQQLLDRFLIGHNRDGVFHRATGREVTVAVPMPSNPVDVKARQQDFGLKVVETPAEAVAGADAVFIACRGSGSAPKTDLIEATLKAIPNGAACFIHGALARDAATAGRLADLAKSRSIPLATATGLSGAFRLPAGPLPSGVRQAAVTVQGPIGSAELDGLEALYPLLAQGAKGLSPVKAVKLLRDDDVWKLAYSPEWSALVDSALSRSNTIQGDSLKEGRTYDVFALHAAEKMARKPRAWVIEFEGGAKAAILVLDGVLKDVNVAARLPEGKIFSTQLYQPPMPGQEHFSELAGIVEAFFQSGLQPWPVQKPVQIAGIIERMAALSEG